MWPKNSKKHPKIAAQCRKYPISYLYTLSQTKAYLYTLSRTIPHLNTLRKNPNLAQNQILIGSQSESSTKKHLNLVSQSESSITAPKKTQTLSDRVEDPSRLSAPAEPSRLAIAYLNTWRVLHPPPPPTTSAHTLTTKVRFYSLLGIQR